MRQLEKTDERPTSALCPRCQVAMTESVYGHGDLFIDECFACGGLWFDEQELQRFVARFRARKEAVEGPPLDGKLRRFILSEPVVYLRCPRCSRPMTRYNFGRISGVIVDRCEHGTWLDGGELEKVVAFIQTGGLVEGERRRVQDLKEQARRAEMRANIGRGVAFLDRMGSGQYLGPLVFWDIW